VDFLTRTFFAAYSTALIPRIWLFIPVALELLWPGGMLGAFLEFAQRFKPRPHPSRPTRFLLWVSAAVIVGLALLDLTQPPLEDPDEWRKMGRMLLAFLMVPGWIFAGLLQTRLAAIWQQWGHRSGESEADG